MDWTFGNARVDVPAQMSSVVRDAWNRIGMPGTWWDGAQRCAMVDEVRAARTCELCSARRTALSAGSVSGQHEAVSDLPTEVVEAVHRLTTDASRITRAWATDRTSVLGDAPYAEIVGLVAVIHIVDVFCSAVGSEPAERPEQTLGEPTRRLPEGLNDDKTAYVLQVHQPTAANVSRALTSVPDTAAHFQSLTGPMYSRDEFTELVWSKRALSRPQVELVASRTSALNECFY